MFSLVPRCHDEYGSAKKTGLRTVVRTWRWMLKATLCQSAFLAAHTTTQPFEHLAGLRDLSSVDISDTSVTPAGAARLRELLPTVTVIH